MSRVIEVANGWARHFFVAMRNLRQNPDRVRTTLSDVSFNGNLVNEKMFCSIPGWPASSEAFRVSVLQEALITPVQPLILSYSK